LIVSDPLLTRGVAPGGLPVGDFAPLVGRSRHTLYAWKKRFDEHGAAGSGIAFVTDVSG
jgi:hypothetical protein